MPTSSRPPAPVNLERFVAQLDGDVSAVRDVVLAIREDFAKRVKQLHLAGQTRDAERVLHHTHALKSALAILAATEVAELAQGLEKVAASGAWDDYRIALDAFTAAVDRVDRAVAKLLK